MPYDWRKEQDEANRRRAREEEISAKQAAWNKKLADDSKKGMDFWAGKMQKEQQHADQQRAKNSTGCAGVLVLLATLIAAIVAVS